MDLAPDEIDIQLRSPADVGRRMIALSAIAHLIGRSLDDEAVAGERDDEEDAADVDGAGEAFDWSSWLEREQLIETLVQSERRLVLATPNSGSAVEMDDEGAAVEALGVLAWAVGRSPLTVLDRGYSYLDLLDAVPSPWDDSTPFLTGLLLRPEDEIATARESAEILSWRAQAEVERRRSTGRERAAIEAAIRDVSAEAASAGVASIGADGDLAIGGEPIASLPESVVLAMVAASRARLRAMNWLCGLGDWDDPILTEI